VFVRYVTLKTILTGIEFATLGVRTAKRYKLMGALMPLQIMLSREPHIASGENRGESAVVVTYEMTNIP
jgi:hypothetical protein